MPSSASGKTIIPPDQHILTVQEALEPLYQRLEQEVETKLVEAAVDAGWSPYDALSAIDQLKKARRAVAASSGHKEYVPLVSAAA